MTTDDTKQIRVIKNADEIDWPRVDLFKKRFQILWDNYQDLDLKTISGSFVQSEDGLYEGGYDSLPNDYRLKGIYTDFRHFYLQTEPTNIRGFKNYLNELINDHEFYEFAKNQMGSLKSDLIENGWLRYKEQPFTTKEVLDVCFNADIFHNDADKILKLLEWMEVLATNTARAMLFDAVHAHILVIRNLNVCVNDLTRTNLYLKIPVISK